MKKLLLFLCLLTWLAGFPQTVPVDSLKMAAGIYMQNRNPGAVLISTESLRTGDGRVVGYLFRFRPGGFVVTSSATAVSPLYAWSPHEGVDLPVADERIWRSWMTSDLQLRLEQSGRLPERERLRISRQWREFLAGAGRSPGFEQWPPEGTTYTGGWLETNWTQSAPYNAMCPVDLNSGNRSVAGCPAIAMAQMINYHREIHGTRFGDGDDYYHSYGSGNSYWIDDDYLSRDFPCFDTLNHWLDSLELSWEYGLNPPLKAALCFACGVAAHQVYSASVSGTFGLEQALMAWQRFGFSESRLVYPGDTALNSLIAANIRAALPVQLGLLVSGGSGGHNVVADGYNTDHLYHFNFGWGGSANGWYTLPPTSIPYNLTIVEGAVLDVKSALYTGISGDHSTDCPLVYPNPFEQELFFHGFSGPALITLYDLSGARIMECRAVGAPYTMGTAALRPGCYFYRIAEQRGRNSTGKIVKAR